MSDEIIYRVKVCKKCKRQVHVEVDHNLGPARSADCTHGRSGLGVMERGPWETVEIPATAVPLVDER